MVSKCFENLLHRSEVKQKFARICDKSFLIIVLPIYRATCTCIWQNMATLLNAMLHINLFNCFYIIHWVITLIHVIIMARVQTQQINITILDRILCIIFKIFVCLPSIQAQQNSSIANVKNDDISPKRCIDLWNWWSAFIAPFCDVTSLICRLSFTFRF